MTNRSLILIPTWIVYVGLLAFAIVCEVAGTDYYFNTGIAVDAVVAGIELAIYPAVLLAIPVFVRWKLGNASWGTFAVYMAVLGTAFVLQATRQRVLGQYDLNGLLLVLATVCLVLLPYFVYKHVLHTQSIVDAACAARNPKGKPSRR